MQQQCIYLFFFYFLPCPLPTSNFTIGYKHPLIVPLAVFSSSCPFLVFMEALTRCHCFSHNKSLQIIHLDPVLKTASVFWLLATLSIVATNSFFAHSILSSFNFFNIINYFASISQLKDKCAFKYLQVRHFEQSLNPISRKKKRKKNY